MPRLSTIPALFSPFADSASRWPWIKAIERRPITTSSGEYWLKERFANVVEVARAAEFIHFACTSEDINNLAHGLMLVDARRDVLLPAVALLIGDLRILAHDHAALPMLARTHGQAATPTTLGKEMANVVSRLEVLAPCSRKWNAGQDQRRRRQLQRHLAAYPAIDWESLAHKLVISSGSNSRLHDADRAARRHGGTFRRAAAHHTLSSISMDLGVTYRSANSGKR